MREHYRNLGLQGGQRTIEMTPEEEAVVLHAYDEGVEALDSSERGLLHRVLAKLKDEIWP